MDDEKPVIEPGPDRGWRSLADVMAGMGIQTPPMHPFMVIDYIGGNCPVQARGTIDGKPFYFRSRGDSWSLGIGGDPIGDPEWEHEEDYSTWPDAGWITQDQAKAFIDKAAGLYTGRNERKS